MWSYTYKELVEVNRLRDQLGSQAGLIKYYSDLWNFADWVMIALLLAVSVTEYSTVYALNGAVQSLENESEASTEQFIAAAWYAKQHQLVLAFALSLAYVKAFKFVRLLPILGPAFYAAVATMANPQVLLFLIIFMYFIFAVAFGCHVAFGMHVGGFGHMFDSFLAIFQASFAPVCTPAKSTCELP